MSKDVFYRNFCPYQAVQFATNTIRLSDGIKIVLLGEVEFVLNEQTNTAFCYNLIMYNSKEILFHIFFYFYYLILSISFSFLFSFFSSFSSFFSFLFLSQANRRYTVPNVYMMCTAELGIYPLPRKPSWSFYINIIDIPSPFPFVSFFFFIHFFRWFFQVPFWMITVFSYWK